MDLTPYAAWIVFLHVAGAFAFAAGHGVSIFVAFRVRRERDPVRIASLLDLSAASLVVAGIGLLGLLGLLGAGIVAGIVLGSFGRAWVWISLVLLLVIGGLMTPISGMYFARLRRAVGQRTPNMKPDQPDPEPVSGEELATLLDSRRPEALLLVGGTGLMVILWLMMFRPF
ncbi:MAG TPA: hypothetical protein VMQ65_07400 [Candidatus Limnocylindria bacterium]|nr:hypothetical protein [Candidatus Limnocylindria bacterium]